jgi:hypothetical protein
MLRRPPVLILLLASAALADEWQRPKDQSLHEPEVKAYVAFLQAFDNAGGSLRDHGARHHAQPSAAEKKALADAAADEGEIDFAKPLVQVVARQLTIDATPEDAWKKAVAAAKEKLAQEEKTYTEMRTNAPKELAELEKVNAEIARADRASNEWATTHAIGFIKAYVLHEKSTKAQGKETLKAQKEEDDQKDAMLKCVDGQTEEERKCSNAKRRRGEITTMLDTAGAKAVKQLDVVQEARNELDELTAALKDKTSKKKLDPLLEPSVAAVKAKLPEIQKAFVHLGAPVFRAAK